jgi:hypothetical protein
MSSRTHRKITWLSKYLAPLAKPVIITIHSDYYTIESNGEKKTLQLEGDERSETNRRVTHEAKG